LKGTKDEEVELIAEPPERAVPFEVRHHDAGSLSLLLAFRGRGSGASRTTVFQARSGTVRVLARTIVLQLFSTFLNVDMDRILRIKIPCLIDERLRKFLKRVDAVGLLLMCHVVPIEVGQVFFNAERNHHPVSPNRKRTGIDGAFNRLLCGSL